MRPWLLVCALFFGACGSSTPQQPTIPSPTSADTAPAVVTPAATYKVKFKTTKGDFVVTVTRTWAPLGAARFEELVTTGFFKDIAVFRVVDGFMAQFGIHGDPAVSAKWRDNKIKDDPVTQSNSRGMVTFATSGPNTRTTQLFINFGNNNRLDGMGFSPFGTVSEGMEVVDQLYKGYGEGAPRGQGPDQGRMQQEGNAYLKKDFPNLDYILSAELLP